MLARSGKHSDVLKDGTPRQDVIAKLGGPKSTEKTTAAEGDDKATCIADSYIVTGKVPEQSLATRYIDMNMMTFGAGEIILFPYEIVRSVIASFSTKENEVSVTYCIRQGVETVSGVPLYR